MNKDENTTSIAGITDSLSWAILEEQIIELTLRLSLKKKKPADSYNANRESSPQAYVCQHSDTLRVNCQSYSSSFSHHVEGIMVICFLTELKYSV